MMQHPVLSSAALDRTLEDPGASPALDLRTAIVSVSQGRLFVRLARSGSRWELARCRPEPETPLDFTARRAIRQELGHAEQYLEQLYTLSLEGSVPWTVTVSYLGLVTATAHPIEAARESWFPYDALPHVSSPDAMIIDYAVQRLRAKLSYTSIAFHLMPEAFTLSELQNTYEAILGHPLDKRNFRRRISSSGALSPTGGTRREGSHRPARLYRFRPDRDPSNYLTPSWTGASA